MTFITPLDGQPAIAAHVAQLTNALTGVTAEPITLTSTLSVAGATSHGSHVSPGTTNVSDLGATANRWRKLYATDLDVTNMPAVQTPVLTIPAGGLYTENIDDGNWTRLSIVDPPGWAHWPARQVEHIFHPDQTNYCGLPKLTFPKLFPTLAVKQVTMRINWWADGGGWVMFYPYLIATTKNQTYPGTVVDLRKLCGVYATNAHLEDTFVWSLPGSTYDDTVQLFASLGRVGADAGDTCGAWARVQSVQIWFG